MAYCFFIISLIFIIKFKESIKLFLENIASIKVGPFEANQKQQSGPEETIKEQITENFISHFILPTQITNYMSEKETIFNALLVNGLLVQNGGLFKVSDKGIKFLRYMKFDVC